jgi:hypothetical protein
VIGLGGNRLAKGFADTLPILRLRLGDAI